MKSILAILFHIAALSSIGVHGSDEHEHNNKMGEGKALVAVDKHKGFKLSPESLQTLGIQTVPINVTSPDIPKKSLVTIKNQKGIYILRSGFFRFVELSSNMNLKSGDQVVVQGMGLIAITDVYTTDESEYGHSH